MQDLKDYTDIIEQLKPLAREPEFNQVLQQLAGDLPKEKRFLIKMEIKRLARPCLRSIDLRGQVDGECKIFEYKGITHYLDDVAIETFEQQIRVFGLYCFGVYESVLATENNFRVMREKAEENRQQTSEDASKPKSQLSQFDIYNLNMLGYARRQHERMNFAVALEIFTETNSSIRATSIDISNNGLKVKLTKEQLFKPGDILSVYFRGLEAEYALDKKHGIGYSVIAISRRKEFQILQLKRLKEAQNAGFDQFLEKFIHGNKRRYKVNMENTIEAIIDKSCEQYFSPSCPSLPVFIEHKDKKLTPRFAMANEVNRQILSYWTDENNELRLGYLINSERLSYLVANKFTNRALFVYVFNHVQQGKVYFYSVSDVELERHPELRNIFWGFGSRKVSWRVYKIQLSDMDPAQAHAPLSIPDSVGNKIKRQNTPPAPRLMSKLINLKYIAQIADVTSDTGQQRYSQLKIERSNLKSLRLFGHPRNKVPFPIKAFRYKFNEQRIENRYMLRTVIQLQARGQTITGISEDVSVNGLRIEIDGEYHGDMNMRVVIGLPKLQEITRKYDITNLQYRVVHCSHDRNVLHLRTVAGEDGQPARKFFEDLIKQNKSQLKTYPDEEEIPGIGHALRCIHAKNPPSLAFLLSKEGVRFMPKIGVLNKDNLRIANLCNYFAEENHLNLEFLFRDRNLEEPFIQRSIKQVKTEHQPQQKELYISFNPADKDPRMVIIPRYDHRFKNDTARVEFIKEALKRGQFIALTLVISTTGKPDLDMIQAELNYVSVYAIHKAKELEEKLWSIGACIHGIDVTDEVLSRYGFDTKVIAKNHQAPAQHTVEAIGIKALLQV
jgi:hypothetical protein